MPWYLLYGIPDGAVVKNHLPKQETQETWAQSLGWDDLLEKEMKTHSSILAWKIPCTEDSDQLHYSLWGHKESDTTEHAHYTLVVSANFVQFWFRIIFSSKRMLRVNERTELNKI